MYRYAYSKLSSSIHSQETVGSEEGDKLGLREGNTDGGREGGSDGTIDGFSEGNTDGTMDGATEGNGLGSITHLPHVITQTSKARKYCSHVRSELHTSLILSGSFLANQLHFFVTTPVISSFFFLLYS